MANSPSSPFGNIDPNLQDQLHRRLDGSGEVVAAEVLIAASELLWNWLQVPFNTPSAIALNLKGLQNEIIAGAQEPATCDVGMCLARVLDTVASVHHWSGPVAYSQSLQSTDLAPGSHVLPNTNTPMVLALFLKVFAESPLHYRTTWQFQAPNSPKKLIIEAPLANLGSSKQWPNWSIAVEVNAQRTTFLLG